jgi:hypothetical protein
MLPQNTRCGVETVVALRKIACAELLNRICLTTYAGDVKKPSVMELALKIEVGLKLSKMIWPLKENN